MYQVFEELFSKKVSNSNEIIAHCLKDISLQKLTKEQSKECEVEITKNEVKDALGNMVFKKSHEKDCVTSEFYKAFWSEFKNSLLLSYKKVFGCRIKHFSKTNHY